MTRRGPLTQTLFDDALRILMDAATPIERVETLPLERADGRVVARDVTAATDVPPFDRAAMDGYAVIAADTVGASAAEPKTLSCVGRVFTGQIPARGVAPGECIAIATGAPMPDGADAVVMVEDTEAHRLVSPDSGCGVSTAATSAGARPTSRSGRPSSGGTRCSDRAASARSRPRA